MVSSSLGAMGSLLVKLRSLLFSPEQELPNPLTSRKQIVLLKQDLEQITTWLVDLSRAEAPNMMARHWMNEVRDLSYDIQDYIDNIMHSHSKGNYEDTMHSSKGNYEDISSEVEEFRTLVNHANDARRRYERYGFGRWASNPSFMVEGQGLDPTLRGEARDLVGISDSKGELTKLLTRDDEQRLKVVSIVGPAGVGKTTLAKEVYLEIGGNFDCRAFVWASRMPDTRRLLWSIMAQVQCHERPPYGCTVQELIDNLCEHLQHHRYFIVIDGLWETTSWDIINSVFPDGTDRSRILITADNVEVALECCDYQSDCILEMKPLSRSYSEELFFNRVFGSTHECSEQLKEASEEIVRICGGLPLATINLASILASQLDNSKLWDNVQECLSSSMRKNLTSEHMLRVIVGLSYSSLSNHLKTCLLYLSMYPDGYTFSKADLVKKWTAEGFVTVVAGKDTYEVAECYFDELVFRGLIQPNHISFSDEAMLYTVHSAVFEVIRYKSIEENFATVIDYSEPIPKLSAKLRRLSLRFSNAKYATKPEGISLSSVWSLYFYGLIECLPSISEFEVLRVLILEVWGDQQELDLSGIERLFQLRYVRITTDTIVKLPVKMSGLRYLETLEIDARVTSVPSDIIHLPGLLHLYIHGKINLLDGIDSMSFLRTLQYFDLSSNSENNVLNLGKMKNLRGLHITCSTALPIHLQRNLIALATSLAKIDNLKSFILAPDASCMNLYLDCSSLVSSPPIFLQRLELLPPICMFSRLPEWAGQLRMLRILKIVVRELTRDDVNRIAALQELAVLSFYVRQPTFESITFNRTAFPVLKYLEFRCGVLRLAFQAQAMPNLKRLSLEFNAHSGEHCSDILSGVEHLLKLQEISVGIGLAPGTDESVRTAVESLLKDTISKHSSPPSFRIRRVNSIEERQEADHEGVNAEAAGLANAEGKRKNKSIRLRFLNSSLTYCNDELKSDDSSPIKIGIFDGDNIMIKSGPLSKAKVEISVFDDGIITHDASESWTAKEFNKHIDSGRDGIHGNRNELAGKGTTVNLINGECDLGNIRFREVSRRARRGRFMIRGRVCDDTAIGFWVQEAAVFVHDHTNKFSHPPKLNDPVYCLEGIVKHGGDCMRLETQGILTVEDFLKALNKDPDKLAEILQIPKEPNRLGRRRWERMIQDARDCCLQDEHGLKSYPCTEENVVLFFNCVHGLVGAQFGGSFTPQDKFDPVQRALVDKLIGSAYNQLDDLDPDHVMTETDMFPRPLHMGTGAGSGPGPSNMSSVTERTSSSRISSHQVGDIPDAEHLSQAPVQKSCALPNIGPVHRDASGLSDVLVGRACWLESLPVQASSGPDHHSRWAHSGPVNSAHVLRSAAPVADEWGPRLSRSSSSAAIDQAAERDHNHQDKGAQLAGQEQSSSDSHIVLYGDSIEPPDLFHRESTGKRKRDNT